MPARKGKHTLQHGTWAGLWGLRSFPTRVANAILPQHLLYVRAILHPSDSSHFGAAETHLVPSFPHLSVLEVSEPSQALPGCQPIHPLEQSCSVFLQPRTISFNSRRCVNQAPSTISPVSQMASVSKLAPALSQPLWIYISPPPGSGVSTAVCTQGEITPRGKR